MLNEESCTYLPIYNTNAGSAPDERGAQTVILMDAISWVEALSETTQRSIKRDGALRSVVIELADPAVTLRGDLFVRDDSAVYQTLADAGRFISLRNVSFQGSDETTPFLAVATRQAHVVTYDPRL